MKIPLLVIFFFLTAVNIQAQHTNVSTLRADSLRAKFASDSLNIFKVNDIVPYIAIDFRNAYTNDHFLSLVGPQLGLTYKKRHTFAIGYYFLNKFSAFQSDKFRNYSFEKINTFNFIYLYKIVDRRRFDILFPIEAGFGRYRAEDKSIGEGTFVESNIVPLGAGIRFDILPHKWIGFKLGFGYRYIHEVESKININGPYFSIGIKLDLLHIYQDFSFYRLKKRFKKAQRGA